jgi:hypothetical protein
MSIIAAFAYPPATGTLYAVFSPASGASAGQFWDTSTSGYEAYNASDWGNYAVAVSQKGSSSQYEVTLPAGASQLTKHNVTIYLQAGGSPAVSDTPILQGDICDPLTSGILPPVASGSTGSLPVTDSSGNVAANLKAILGTVLTETAGYLAAGFKKLFNVASPTLTADTTGSTFSAVPDTSGTTTLLGRFTSSRAAYLDNLNVGGAVASHADIVAINQSASKHLLLATVGQYEPGETYTIECRTFSAVDGTAVNADTTPTLAATGNVSGDLSANLSVASNPATGVYRWTYTPGSSPTLEQIVMNVSATIASATYTLAAYTQTVDFATAVFTATDQSHLTAIYDKLPTHNIADENDLTSLASQVSSALGAGAGAKTCNLTLATSGNEPVGQALVWIATDAQGTDVIAGSESTSDLGGVTFFLTPGTYYRFAKLSGYNFTNPQSFSVTSDATQSFAFSDAAPVSAPSAAPIGTTQLTVVLGSRVRLPAAYEGAILGPWQILLVDPFGNAASMAGKTVKLVVYNAASSDAQLFELSGTVDDSVTNQITFQGTTDDTANVGIWRCTCANTTDNQVLFTGTLAIRDSAPA